jgi:hypothetical protein
MTEIPDIALLSNLPEWMQEDPSIQALCFALDRQFKEVIACIPEAIIIPVIRQLEYSDLVDLLSYHFHLDFYDPTDTIERRRDLVANSIVWHRRKGTVALVQEVIDYWYPGGATLEEWFSYKNDPAAPPGSPTAIPPNYPIDDPGGLGTWHDRYRFRISIDQAVIPPEAEARAIAIIERYKPHSRWMEDTLRARVSTLDSIYWAGGTAVWQHIQSEAPQLAAPPAVLSISDITPGTAPAGSLQDLIVQCDPPGIFLPTAIIVYNGIQQLTRFLNARYIVVDQMPVGTDTGAKSVFVREGRLVSNTLIFTVT